MDDAYLKAPWVVWVFWGISARQVTVEEANNTPISKKVGGIYLRFVIEYIHEILTEQIPVVRIFSQTNGIRTYLRAARYHKRFFRIPAI